MEDDSFLRYTTRVHFSRLLAKPTINHAIYKPLIMHSYIHISQMSHAYEMQVEPRDMVYRFIQILKDLQCALK